MTVSTLAYRGKALLKAHAVTAFDFSAAYFAREPVMHAYIGRPDMQPLCGRRLKHRSRLKPIDEASEITCKRCAAMYAAARNGGRQ